MPVNNNKIPACAGMTKKNKKKNTKILKVIFGKSFLIDKYNIMNVPIMSEVFAQGKKPEYLFFVGSAGSFDDRAKKISRAFSKILNHFNVDFAILGTEESSLGDPAKRAGNEFVFQMAAHMNIELFNMYEVKKIITTCPHNYNILKNEYPELGGKYEVYHHTEFIEKLLAEIETLDENRELFLAKEISKKYQKYYKGTAKELNHLLSELTIRGEWVVVIRAHKSSEKSLSFTEVLGLDLPPKIKAKLLATLSDKSVKEWYNKLIE